MAGKKKLNKMRRREAKIGYAFISVWLVEIGRAHV